jgi:GT2 family glycosyltransferase
MISFIILNYGNISDTIECINSIKKSCLKYKYSILVVDNASITNSEYKTILDLSVDCIVLDHNYGFAIANNIGIRYCKTKYNSDFFCALNNDIIINQNNFIDLILKNYQKYSFDILGGKIESPSNESVNPFPVLKNIKEVKLEIRKSSKFETIYSNSFLYFCLKIVMFLKHLIVINEKNKNGANLLNNVALHCCAIIFSKKYVNKFYDSFDSRTFLFHEEEFLYQRIINYNLISIYDPSLIVFHKEGSSLKKSKKNERLRRLYREKERIKSLNILLNDLEGGKHEK